MKKTLWRESAVIFALVLTASSVTGCNAAKDKADAEALEEVDNSVEVTTANPTVRNVSIESNFSGTVEAEDTVVVVPKVAGEVIEKNFEVGDHVNEGDLLFRIDDETARLQLDQAKVQVDSAEAGYTAQQATNASTKAQATETIAKISSNEAQLDYAVDSAYAQKRAAGNSWDSLSASEDFYETEYEEAKHDLSKTKKKKKKLKDQKEHLESLLSSYKSKAASDADEANKWLKSQGYSSETELSSAYSSAASAYASADAAIDGYENSIQNYELQKRTNGNSADSQEMTYYTAEENVALAEQNREIYKNYTKATTLFGVNAQVVGADANLVTSEASVRNAKISLENAENALENYTITAPVSGIITAIGVTLHNMASSATEAYKIETDSLNKIIFYVAEETVKNVEEGNEALITKNGEEYNAKITNVGTTLDEDTGLFKVEAMVQGEGNDLMNGSTVSIRTITRLAKNAITVPVDSVYFDDEQAYVLLADGEKAVRRDIETGISDEDGIEVTDGLSTDDDVIVSWTSMLKDGMDIKITGSDKKASANGAAANELKEKRITDPAEITAGSATVEAASEEYEDRNSKSGKPGAE